METKFYIKARMDSYERAKLMAKCLKRFFREDGRVRLQPANQSYPPQFYDSVRVQGRLIGVIRRVD
jgi:SOS-response transcriptional repressor LexA